MGVSLSSWRIVTAAKWKGREGKQTRQGEQDVVCNMQVGHCICVRVSSHYSADHKMASSDRVSVSVRMSFREYLTPATMKLDCYYRSGGGNYEENSVLWIIKTTLWYTQAAHMSPQYQTLTGSILYCY